MDQRIFFTSDLHFGHRSILWLGNGRPFKTTDEMDQALIDNWNSVVKPGDVVYILGDMSLRGDYTHLESCISKLNGNKHLLIGNHDKEKEVAKLRNKNIIQSMHDYHKIKVKLTDGNTLRIILSHFPILEFDGALKGNTIHLYGHIHDAHNYDDIYTKLGYPALNVGCDVSSTFPNTKPFTPINLVDILEKMNSIYHTSFKLEG